MLVITYRILVSVGRKYIFGMVANTYVLVAFGAIPISLQRH